MRKILFSTLIIGAVSAVVIGGTMSFFSDTEISTGNTFTAGTIEIAIDDQLHWSDTFVWDDIKPGKDFEIEFEITNEGVNPLKLWKIIKCVVTEENGVIEPEEEWYIDNGIDPLVGKNDIDSAIIYEMEVDGNMVVNKEAGITMSQIKDNYIGLMKFDIGITPSQFGILDVGESINVKQRYYMPEGTENWAQSDKMTFVMEIEARQLSAPEPLQQMMFMENKEDADYSEDKKIGILKYDYQALSFNYDLFATGLDDINYQLIYYPDPWAYNKQVVLIGGPVASVDGVIDIKGQSEGLGMDLPKSVSGFDDNYPYGAKVWLVPSNSLSGNTLSWSYNQQFLYENWPGLINYKQGVRPNEELNCEYEDNKNLNPSGTKSVLIDNVISQTDWTGDSRDYSSANVEFSYLDPGENNKFSGTITANGLKPHTTYQVKFLGKPECEYVGGNDVASEYIGYEGRWTVLNVACTGVGCNRTDAEYEASKTNSECVAGYLVWGFFTTNSLGSAVKSIETDCSYHVLRCNGGVCGLVSDAQLKNTDGLLFPGYPYCDVDDVEGELEPGRALCDALILNSGMYELKIMLTEESFHQGTFGTWTSVLDKDIAFEIQ